MKNPWVVGTSVVLGKITGEGCRASRYVLYSEHHRSRIRLVGGKAAKTRAEAKVAEANPYVVDPAASIARE